MEMDSIENKKLLKRTQIERFSDDNKEKKDSGLFLGHPDQWNVHGKYLYPILDQANNQALYS